MPTLSNDFSSVPVKKLGFTQAIYTPGSKSNKSNLSNKSEDNTTNSQPPFGLVMRPSSPTSTMNTSVAKCLMMGIAPSPTIQLKITDMNTSGGSDTAASSERFTAFSSFLGSIQASPTIGTKSAVKALSSALARSPTAMIKVPTAPPLDRRCILFLHVCCRHTVDAVALALLPDSAFFHLQKKLQSSRLLLKANHSLHSPYSMTARKLQFQVHSVPHLQYFATMSLLCLLVLFPPVLQYSKTKNHNRLDLQCFAMSKLLILVHPMKIQLAGQFISHPLLQYSVTSLNFNSNQVRPQQYPSQQRSVVHYQSWHQLRCQQHLLLFFVMKMEATTHQTAQAMFRAPQPRLKKI